MPRKPPPPATPRRKRDTTFRRSDAMRAYRAAVDAGMANPRIVIDSMKRTISIVPGDPERAENDLDRELADFQARHAG